MCCTCGRLQIAGIMQPALVIPGLGAGHRPAADASDLVAGQRGAASCEDCVRMQIAIRKIAGLPLTPYYFAPKLRVVLQDNPGVAGATGARRVAGGHAGHVSDLAPERRQAFRHRCIDGGAHLADGCPSAKMVGATLRLVRHTAGDIAGYQAFRRDEYRLGQRVDAASQCRRPVRRADRRRQRRSARSLGQSRHRLFRRRAICRMPGRIRRLFAYAGPHGSPATCPFRGRGHDQLRRGRACAVSCRRVPNGRSCHGRPGKALRVIRNRNAVLPPPSAIGWLRQ